VKFQRPTLLPILPFGAPDQGYATMRVTSPFARRADGFHGAIDIGNARLGDVLISPAAGKVIAVGNLGWPWSQPTTRFASGNYGGLMAVIEHAPGVVSIFAHMRMTAVRSGQIVMAGQKVGEIGESGSATGQGHVHFGMQAPAHRVPAGVSTHRTPYGLGLDIDPWPLITGQAELLEDTNDMPQITGLIQAVAGAGNNLRRSPSTSSDRRYLAEDIWVDVTGIVPDGDPWTVGDKSGTTWYEVEAYGERWYIATVLLPGLSLTKQGAEVIPAQTVTVIDEAAVGRAVADLNSRLDQWVAQRPR
jgi:murein DD-endopeptidase MepM/ murein hydrolase activator NlpD